MASPTPKERAASQFSIGYRDRDAMNILRGPMAVTILEHRDLAFVESCMRRHVEDLAAIIEAAVRDERAACEDIAREIACAHGDAAMDPDLDLDDEPTELAAQETALVIADAIRARGKSGGGHGG